MMKCSSAQELFSDYVESKLDRALTLSLENHLGACANCQEEVAGLRQMWSSLERMPEVELPLYFHENLMSRLDAELRTAEEKAAQKRSLWDWRVWFRPSTLGLTAAGLALVLMSAEVVQTQRAQLGPIGWFLSALRPAPVPTLGLQTGQAEWLPDPQGGGTLVVHLRALPDNNGRVNTLHYKLDIRGLKSDENNGAVNTITSTDEVSSKAEKTITFSLESSPVEAGATLSVTLSGLEDKAGRNQKTLPIPIAPAP